MPKTTVQKVIFGLLMSFFMVLAMEMYNTGLRNGGLTNAGILNALRELPLMFAMRLRVKSGTRLWLTGRP